MYVDILKYTGEFLEVYSDFPKFALIWLNDLSHSRPNGINHADMTFLDFLKKNRKILKNSFVIFMADHGPRFGKMAKTYTGSVETNNPLFVISVPKELRNSPIYKLLQMNSRNLQTIFDTRATLLDILKHQPQENFEVTNFKEILPDGRGTSFLREQPEPRSCKTLPISFQYCLCPYKLVPVKEETMKTFNFGKVAVDTINQKISNSTNDTSLCLKLKFDEILKLETYEPEIESKTYVLSVRSKKPQEGEFKMILRRYDNEIKVVGSIDRINKYGEAGDCAPQEIERFCYCLKRKATKKATKKVTKKPNG